MANPKVLRLTFSITTDSTPPTVIERVAYDARQALSAWLDAMGHAGMAKSLLVDAIVSRALLETTDIDLITGGNDAQA